MPKRDVRKLAQAAGSDLQPDTPLVRGRGLSGIISDDSTSSTQQGQQVDMSTSTPAESKRPVKSFRLREDLTHQIEIRAAQQRRKLYEVVEEALEEYLDRHQADDA